MSTDDKTRIVPDEGVRPGVQLNGIYEIDEHVATGGMGEVYRGHNIQTGDPVAIKLVLREFARDQGILALFRKEASILNHLSHDAIVRYHVFTIDPVLGRPYLAMEFVDGQSLGERLQSGPLDPRSARRMLSRVASGLSVAHEAGVIHRDLSPDNIVLQGGNVDKTKIIDFGIARSANIGGGTLLGGSFAGKYKFVSPEQLGLFGGEVTERVGPVDPLDTATIQRTLAPGFYEVRAGSRRAVRKEIAPAVLAIGDERQPSNNDLLLP